ncbi:MAG: MFS transporter, partial [Planctomycetota bacterium]|nr:MFS transporter [Planctomycetota bacterium]
PLIGASKALGLALAPWAVLVLRALDKIGKGVRGAPRDAVLADYSEGMQGKAFGYQRALDHAGAMAGGVAAYALLQWLQLDLAWSIGLSIVPGLCSVLAIILFVHDQPERRPQPAAAAADQPPLCRAFWLYAVAASLFALANSSDAFLLLRAHEMGMPVAMLPLAWSLLHVVKSGTSFLGGALSDRWGRKPLLMAGWLLYAAVYAIFAQASGVAAAWLLFAAYGVFFGATEGVGKALVADLVPAGSRGRAFGILGMLEGSLLIPTSLLTGFLWDLTGSGVVPLSLNALCAMAAAAWLFAAVSVPNGSLAARRLTS